MTPNLQRSKSRERIKPINPESPSLKSRQENHLDFELLRVKTRLQLKKIEDAWVLSEDQLCEYFAQYELLSDEQFSVAGLFQTEGLKLVRNENKIYFGQIWEKKKHGMGISMYREGKIYEGRFQSNEKHGRGCEMYPNGNIYIGEFSQNKKHGQGSFFWFSLWESPQKNSPSTIERYEGSWWGGLPDGEGQHHNSKGDVYIGQFKNGLKHGNGLEYYSNKDRYKGEFINGLPEGYGEYLWSDKSNYKGDFKQGYRNGYGVWQAGDHRAGKEGQQYKGHYMLDKKHGFGVYDWANGYMYKGMFMEDLRCGEGELIFQGEVIYKGYWQDGEKCDQMEFHQHVSSKISRKLERKSLPPCHSDNFSKTISKNSRQKSAKQIKIPQSFIVNFNQIPEKTNHRNCEYCVARRTKSKESRPLSRGEGGKSGRWPRDRK